MKIIAINGSPRKEGNTYEAIRMVLDELEKEGMETEVLHIGNKAIRGCTGCNLCFKNRNGKCVISDDCVNEMIDKLKDADGILLGSPVYYSGITGTMKSFLDRVFYVNGANGNYFKGKVGAAVTAVRRSGGLPAYDQLNKYIQYSEMLIATSNYWNVIHGLRPGEAVKDDEGRQIMSRLGKNMAWALKLIDHGKDEIKHPESEGKVFTHFVR
ncbi:flavodoxin family protein [Fusibacter sp. JL216-2]|uniref:flavodoxin family protein n=1 Tax=Fusibacter sp. JL216-2 TaxID=3071453 RepID=UPI003D345735